MSRPEHEKGATVALTARELNLIESALDSHVYWQLSDEDNRNDGYVVNEDEEDEYLEERVEVRALSAKLMAAVNVAPIAGDADRALDWLRGDRKQPPTAADLAAYIQERNVRDYPATRDEPAGVPPNHDFMRRAALALANLITPTTK